MGDQFVIASPHSTTLVRGKPDKVLVARRSADKVLGQQANPVAVISRGSSPTPLVQQVARRDVVSRADADQFIYRQGGSTASGTSGDSLHVPPINFSFGDAAHAIFTTVINCTLTQLSVVIDTAFNGVGAVLQMSVGATVVLPSSEVDPTRALEYQVAPALQLIAGDSIFLSITPGSGATTGAGRIFIELQ